MARLHFIFAIMLLCQGAVAQDIPLNKYGLPVVGTIALYKQLVKADSNQQMVNIARYIPGIRMDIRYATRNNFTKRVLYRNPLVLLRRPAARALKAVQEDIQ